MQYYLGRFGFLLKAIFIAGALTCIAWPQEGPPVDTSTPAPRTADGHPDFTGYWKGTKYTNPVGNIAKDLPGLKLPLSVAGEAAFQHSVSAAVAPESRCGIGGIPRHNASGLPFRVMQNHDQVAFLYLDDYYRLIPTDHRKHAAAPHPSLFGDEIGYWHDETFVIDSIGFKDAKVWADEHGSPLSDALHITELWTRPDADHIHVYMVIDDPKFYTRKFTYSRTWNAADPADQVDEHSCTHAPLN